MCLLNQQFEGSGLLGCDALSMSSSKIPMFDDDEESKSTLRNVRR